MSEEQLVHRSVEHLHGPEEVSYKEDELVVVCLVRDAGPLVKPFVEHYFSLGVKHVAFLDNGSTDGTVEALEGYDNVTVLRSRLSYKSGSGERVGNGWTRECLFKQYLIGRFSRENRWCLCVDIDELFDYPYSDTLGLGSLLRYLNSKSYTAVAAQMLDMFAEKPLTDRADDPDEPLKETHRFYDISSIKRRNMKRQAHLHNNTLDSEEMEVLRCGIRDTVFGTAPYLTKFPLVFSDGETLPMDSSSHGVSNARVADFTGVLFHYKFLDEHFRKQARQAVQEGHRWRDSVVYKRYLEVLEDAPNLQVKQETSRKLGDVNDLLENRFLVVSEDYVDWVGDEEESNVLGHSGGQPGSGGSPDLAGAFLESRRRERFKNLRIQRLQGQRLLRERRLKRRVRNLEQQLDGIRASRTWKILEKLRGILTGALNLGRRLR